MITMIMMRTVMTMMMMMIMMLMVVMMEPVLTSHELVFWVLQTHSVPTCNILFSSISQKMLYLLNHLVLGVDESIVDAFGAVAEVEDGVDFLSTVKGLRDATSPIPWNSSWERTRQQEVTRLTLIFSSHLNPRMSKALSLIYISSSSSIESTFTLPRQQDG